jgi:hypothetical protein
MGPCWVGADRAGLDLGWQVTARQLLRRLLDVRQHGIRVTVPASVDDKTRHLALGPPLDDKDVHLLALVNRMRRHGGTNDSPTADGGHQARLAGVEPDAGPGDEGGAVAPSLVRLEPARQRRDDHALERLVSIAVVQREVMPFGKQPPAGHHRQADRARVAVQQRPALLEQALTKRSRGSPPAVDSE